MVAIHETMPFFHERKDFTRYMSGLPKFESKAGQRSSKQVKTRGKVDARQQAVRWTLKPFDADRGGAKGNGGPS
jgi:hypothetical protein